MPTATDPEHGGEFVFIPRLHEPGPQTVLGKTYPRSRRRAGPRGARRSCAPSGDRRACRAQARAPFRRRRAAAGAGRAAGEALPRHRRRPQGDREGAGRRRRRPGTRSARKLKRPSEWIDRGLRATGVERPRSRRVLRRAWRCSASRCGGRRRRRASPTTKAAWIDGLAQRLDIANRFAQRVAERARPAGAGRDGARPARLGRNAADRSRAPKAGTQALDAAADGAGIPAEVTMTPTSTPRPAANCCSAPACCSPGPFLPKLARAEGPRPAHADDRAARRARRARGGRAGRRSGLGQAARRQGADARRQDAGAAARLVLRAQSGDAEPASALSRPAQATIVHAAATPYRERSHFDGQDVLESGCRKPGARRYRLAQPRARRARAGRRVDAQRPAAPSRSAR